MGKKTSLATRIARTAGCAIAGFASGAAFSVLYDGFVNNGSMDVGNMAEPRALLAAGAFAAASVIGHLGYEAKGYFKERRREKYRAERDR